MVLAPCVPSFGASEDLDFPPDPFGGIVRCSEKMSSAGDGGLGLTPYGSCGRSLHDQVEMERMLKRMICGQKESVCSRISIS